jgi:hypothetical protein
MPEKNVKLEQRIYSNWMRMTPRERAVARKLMKSLGIYLPKRMTKPPWKVEE